MARVRIYQNTIDTASSVIGAALNVTSQLLTTFLTGYLAIQRITSIGAIMTTGSLSANVYNGLANLGPELNTIRGVTPLFKKYHLDALSRRTDPVEATATITNNLVVHQLTYAYGNKMALAPVSFTVPFPSKVAIVGDSGVGKSTLLNILSGKLKNYQGSVRLGTQELKQLPLAVVQGQVLYIDQLPYIFNETIRYNLTLGDNFSDGAIWHALAESNLADYVRQLPARLDTLAGEKGRLFSGGQRQRLALARGLLRNRKILLIDEGTSSLNRASAIDVEDQFLSLPSVTVLFVTHQLHPENRDRFDQIIQLHSPDTQQQ
ncbi:ATP-binding cassette sub-family B member 5 [Schleiferilactobacillus shenzhenensis LY-73]|uniref:ATP-binding cassette sub-family B member 5 n=1 Tax=Schleiferilactobacillus shenzhenensis LY-73 TaxID=1231336 RepID=U4TMA3_9LACO|nr:ATP-binding cassette sub-family B member 5 [Schleiferilactobacillus shenzhenensis LY-73]